MYIKINNKKIKIKELTKFWDRFKGYKFYLEPITEGLRFPHKKFVTTNFLCQKIDIVLTNKDDLILAIYENYPSEKYIFGGFKTYYTYFLPVHSTKGLKVKEKLKVFESKAKKNNKKNSK